MPAHTSTKGWPVTSTFGIPDPGHQPRLLGAGDEVVDEHTEASLRARPERGDGPDDVVDAVHRLDDHADLAQVVAPHVLEQLGVVAALDPDPARRGDPGPDRRAGDRARRRDHRARRPDAGRTAQRHRATLEQEPAGLPGEVALVLLAVAQRHGLDAPLHDIAAEAAGTVLDDHADGDVDLGVADGPAGVRHVVEDVAFVGHGDPIQPREPAAVAERPKTMGSTSRHITSIAVIAAAGIVGAGLAGCSSGDDDASTAQTMEVAQGASGRDLLDGDQVASETEAGGDAADAAPTVAADAPAEQAADIPTLQVPGQAIAIEARATLEADDVKAAVDRVTTTVTTRGGRVAAADVDYGRPDDAEDGGGTTVGARATLVLEVPPGDLPAVVTALEDLGTVLSFDQLAEDVTDRLADLDTRTANMRASVERVRALYAEAVDIDSVVRLEAELTRRETDLEVLLATQSALEDRVTMSTLTLDITSTPTPTTPVDDDDQPGIADAASAGWGAFVGGLFAIVLVLAAIAPFALAALIIALIGLAVHRRIVRRRPAATTTADVSSPERPREDATASRPG